jgi:hypothetical protein
VVCGNVAALGGMIGCNDGEFEDFLLEELDSYRNVAEPLLKAIRDPLIVYAASCFGPLIQQGLCASEALISDAQPTHPCYTGSHVCF